MAARGNQPLTEFRLMQKYARNQRKYCKFARLLQAGRSKCALFVLHDDEWVFTPTLHILGEDPPTTNLLLRS